MMSGAANHPETKSKPTDGSASPSASPNTASYLPEDGDAGVDPEHIPGTGAASVGVTRLFRQRDARSLNCLALVETLPYFLTDPREKEGAIVKPRYRLPLLLVGTGDGRVIVIDASTGEERAQFPTSKLYVRHFHWVAKAPRWPRRRGGARAVERNCDYLLATSMDGSARVWDLDSARERAVLARQDTEHRDAINASTVVTLGGSPSTRGGSPYLLTGSYDKTVRCWDLRGSGKSEVVYIADAPIFALVEHNRYLLVGLKDGRVVIVRGWRGGDPKEARDVAVLRLHSSYVTVVKVCGGRVYTASHDGTALSLPASFMRGTEVRRPPPPRALVRFKGHRKGVFCVEVFGRLVLTGSADGTVRSWDSKTGACLRVYEHHRETVHEILLWKGRMFTCSADATASRWEPSFRCEFCDVEHEEGCCPIDEVQCEHCYQFYPPLDKKRHKKSCMLWPHCCPNGLYGCPEMIPLHAMSTHVAACEYAPRTCPHRGCRERVGAPNLAKHRRVCPFRTVVCDAEGCGREMRARDLVSHRDAELGDCPATQITCVPCGSAFARRDMDAHNAVCPRRAIPCAFGCGASFPADEEDQHCAGCPKRPVICAKCGEEFTWDETSAPPRKPLSKKKKKRGTSSRKKTAVKTVSRWCKECIEKASRPPPPKPEPKPKPKPKPTVHPRKPPPTNTHWRAGVPKRRADGKFHSAGRLRPASAAKPVRATKPVRTASRSKIKAGSSTHTFLTQGATGGAGAASKSTIARRRRIGSSSRSSTLKRAGMAALGVGPAKLKQ